MNLGTPSVILASFKLTPEAIEDRHRYNQVKDYTFSEEVLQAAWAPWRYHDWCLDEEERKRIESYRQL